MNTKIRTIISGIAASASIGVAPVAPVVTQAAANDGDQKLTGQI
jgi:formate/nitrite transporter FocA (FNT family)